MIWRKGGNAVPAQTTLPMLPDADLAEQFGDDLDGIRRYRLLQAVLVTGMTQREAAEESEFSERTVRNVLRAYAEGGLEALRSRRAVATRGTTAAEQALAAALEAEP